MNAAEKARAFSLVAPHMSADKRKEIADAIAAEVLDRSRPTASGAEQAYIPGMEPGREEPNPIVDFLQRNGHQGADLVRLTGQMTEAVTRMNAQVPFPAGLLPGIYQDMRS